MIIATQAARLLSGLAVMMMALATVPVIAAETDWQENLGSKARVISSGPIDPKTGSVDLAIQLEMNKGWKTYWRNPGDSGIPPEFDFSKSSNLGDFDILWPAPKSFSDDFGTSVGYKGQLVLPIRAVAGNPVLPLIVDLTLRYGVCERICVPVENTFSLVITRSSQRNDTEAALIEQAIETVPARAGPNDAFAVTSVRLDGDAPSKRLVVTARLEDASKGADLYIEGPKDWYLPIPVRTPIPDGSIAWTISLADLPKAADISGKDVTFTLVSGKHAVEQIWHLD